MCEDYICLTPGIRTVYQNRYCDTNDHSSKHVTASLKECADKCHRTYKQFKYGKGGNCNGDNACKCYCYMENEQKCTSWSTDNNYIQYAFNEPGQFTLSKCRYIST